MLNDPGTLMLLKPASPAALPVAATGATPLPQDGAPVGDAAANPPFLQTLLRSQSLLQALADDAAVPALPADGLEAAEEGQFLSADGKLLPSALLQAGQTGEGGVVPALAGDPPASAVTAALRSRAADITEDEPSGDEGQIINPLLQGMNDEGLAGRAGQQQEDAMDLMTRRNPVRTLPEGAVQAQTLIATAQGSQESQSDAPNEGALRLAMLDSAQGAGLSAIDSNSGGQQQTAPLQGILQPAPVQAHSTDKAAASLTLQTPMQQAQWGDEMGQQVKWLISQKMQSAEMKLNPPQLGAIEVRITVQHDQVNLHFSTPHALVKDSLEESLPRLREILQESGLNLADVDVSQQDSAERQFTGEEADFDPARHGIGQEAADAEADEADRVTAVRHGVVDFYA